MNSMGRAAAVGAREKFIRNFSCEPEGKIELGQPWLQWENNIKIDPKEIYLIDVE